MVPNEPQFSLVLSQIKQIINADAFQLPFFNSGKNQDKSLIL